MFYKRYIPSKLKALFVFVFLLLLSIGARAFQIVNLKEGFADISGVNLENEIIDLEGTAKFIWEDFISVDSFEFSGISGNNIDILQSWDNQSVEQKYQRKGYGTYFFRIKVSPAIIGEQLVIRPNHFISYASEVYVNGALVSNNGSVGRSISDINYQPSRNTYVMPFVVVSEYIDVVIYVSNFNHFRGGIFNSLTIGKVENVIQHRERMIFYDLVIIISLIIMFLYHFVLFFVNSKDTVPLFFSLTCLFFAIDFSVQDTMSFFLAFPNAGFKLSSILQLTMPYLLPASFVTFTYALFPNEVSKVVRNITIIVASLLVLLTLFINSSETSFIVKPHFMYVFLLILYIYWVLYKALKNKRDGALLFLVAYLIFSLCAISDLMYVFELFYTQSLVSTGLMVFVFLLSVLQGKRMVVLYKNNLNLSKNLQELNINLEEKVKIRTSELNNSLEKLKRLDGFKEDMTRMMIHDLKAPLSAVINVKKFNNETGLNMVQQSGYKMLNLVQNILNVYKYDSAEVTPNYSAFKIVSVIESAIEEVKIMAQLKGVTISYNKKAKCVLNADYELITRVLVNLLSNAIKFSYKNEFVEISIANVNGLLEVSVVNLGPHIPENKQEEIFERFGQSEKAKGARIGSTGLGLTFCKMAIQAHKGVIGVDSKPDSKVRFWFTIPEILCADCKTCVRGEIDEYAVEFTDEEKKHLAPYIKELLDYDVFEITKINKVLKEVESKSRNIKRWIENIETSIYSGNSEEYYRLLK